MSLHAPSGADIYEGTGVVESRGQPGVIRDSALPQDRHHRCPQAQVTYFLRLPRSIFGELLTTIKRKRPAEKRSTESGFRGGSVAITAEPFGTLRSHFLHGHRRNKMCGERCQRHNTHSRESVCLLCSSLTCQAVAPFTRNHRVRQTYDP